MERVKSIIQAGPFSPTWASLLNYRIPQWYEDAKFGIFIHWGVYSVPAFNSEWYPRNMYVPGSAEFHHHVETYGPQSKFGYKDFIPEFRAERFDPEQWVELFKEAGAKFVVPVAEHHDGFAMYDTNLSRWNATKMGPRRDIIGELARATRAAGLTFGVSSHRAEHWWFYDQGQTFDSDVRDPAYADFYGPARPKPPNHHDVNSLERPDESFLEDWLSRCCELVDRYEPQLFWFDWWIEHLAFKPYLQQFAAYYYNRAARWPDEKARGVAINYKYDAYPEGSAVFDIERGQLKGTRPLFWQTDTSVSKNSWSYIRGHEYKSARSLLHDLIDIVSKNGAMLLNIGPRADGTIPEFEQQLLREIGQWLKINGECIYGTRPWRFYGEGPTEIPDGAFTDTKRKSFTGQDIRFTCKGNLLYAICLGWPGQSITIRSLTAGNADKVEKINAVEILGCDGPLSWKRNSAGLTLQLPAKPPCDHAYVVKLHIGEFL